MRVRSIRSSRTGRGIARVVFGRAAILGTVLVAAVGCSSGATRKPDAARTTTSPVVRERPALARPDLPALAEATTFGKHVRAPLDRAPMAETRGVVLHVKRDIAVYEKPGGTAFARLPAHQLGSPTWVPVVAYASMRRQGDWAQVLLPSRPNGSTGWVRTAAAEVEQARSPFVVDVDLAAKRMVVRENGREIGAWRVGVGASRTPTPRGRTFIMAAIEETVTRFSPVILPLGTHSETWSTYGGGPGTVALHGWPDPSVFGRAASDGCVRVPGEALRLLASLPLGTLVLLR